MRTVTNVRFLFCGALGSWQVCIVSFLAGKNFEQISSLGRKYSPTTYMAFGTTRKCEEAYTEPLMERKLVILFYSRIIAHSFLFNWLKIAKFDIFDQNYFNRLYKYLQFLSNYKIYIVYIDLRLTMRNSSPFYILSYHPFPCTYASAFSVTNTS